MTRPARHRELAEKAVATKGVSIALACLSETCFRYSTKRDEENEMIANLMVGMTDVHKTWGSRGMLSAPAERQRACLEPQARAPDLLR